MIISIIYNFTFLLVTLGTSLLANLLSYKGADEGFIHVV